MVELLDKSSEVVLTTIKKLSAAMIFIEFSRSEGFAYVLKDRKTMKLTWYDLIIVQPRDNDKQLLY